MKIRLMVLLLMWLLPHSAVAGLPIFDIGATPSTIANTTTDASRAATTATETKTQWSMLKKMGDKIKAVAEFYKETKKDIEHAHAVYDMYRKAVKSYIEQAEIFYNSVMDAYDAMLDAAEFVAEIGSRIQAYIQEGRDIIKYANETLQKCQKIVTSGVDQIKALSDQKKEQEKEMEAHEKEVERLEAQIAELEGQNNDTMSPEDQQKLAQMQAELDALNSQKPGDASYYQDQLNKLYQQLGELQRLQESYLTDNEHSTSVAGLWNQAIDSTGLDLSSANSVAREIQKIEAQILIMQQKYADASNNENLARRKAELEEAMAELQSNNNGEFNVANIRNYREQLAVQRAKSEAYKQYLQNLENQIFNYNRQIEDMFNDCRYHAQMLVARVQRLVCNMTTGVMSRYANKFDNITRSMASSAGAVNSMVAEAGNARSRANILTGKADELCPELKGELQHCPPECDEDTETCKKCNQLAQEWDKNCNIYHSAEPVAVPSLASGVPECEKIIAGIKANVSKKVECKVVEAYCFEGNSEKEGDNKVSQKDHNCYLYCNYCKPGANICAAYLEDISASKDETIGDSAWCGEWGSRCAAMENSPFVDTNPAETMACQVYEATCVKKQEEKEKSTQGEQKVSAAYSIHNSQVIAQAANDVPAITETPTTTQEGIYVLPDAFVHGCNLTITDLESNDAAAECLAKYNEVRAADTGTAIQDDTQDFYKALRRIKSNDKKVDEIFDKTVSASDGHTAQKDLNDAYAQYLASAYFTGLDLYAYYFSYKDNVLKADSETRGTDTSGEQAGITFAEKRIADIISDIYKIWAQEEVVSSLKSIIDNQITREQIRNAAKEDFKPISGGDDA